MKKLIVCLLAAVWCLCAACAWAEAVPANPNAKPGNAVLTTPTAAPEVTNTPEVTDTPTDAPLEPTVEPAPAQEESAETVDVLDGGDLTDEMIAQLDEQVRELLEHEDELLANQEDLRNILLIGLDARPGETKSRSDTIILVTLDPKSGRIKLTSIMRDLYVHIPGVGNNRINAAYYQGGAQLLMDTIEENFGLRVDEYVAVDLTMVVEAIDDLGGLTLTVDSRQQLNAINGVIDAYNAQFGCPTNSDLLTELGEQQMNGKQVQAYGRYRKIDSDFMRTERQREVLSKLYERVTEKSLTELSLLASRYIDRVDTNLTLTDMISLLPTLLSMKDAQIDQLRLPDDGDYQSKTVSGMAVLVPNLQACRDKLSAFIQAQE